MAISACYPFMAAPEAFELLFNREDFTLITPTAFAKKRQITYRVQRKCKGTVKLLLGRRRQKLNIN
jgi:hypothetical protein